jgi:hypothetical protein
MQNTIYPKWGIVAQTKLVALTYVQVLCNVTYAHLQFLSTFLLFL